MFEKVELTQKVLREIMTYEPAIDALVWKKRKLNGKLMPVETAKNFNEKGLPGKEVGGLRSRSPNATANVLGNKLTIKELKEIYGAVPSDGSPHFHVKSGEAGYTAFITNGDECAEVGTFKEHWHAVGVCREAIRMMSKS